MTNAEIIWQFLRSKGYTAYATAGIMGNMYAESGLEPKNLQYEYEKSLSMTDAQYTAAVDNGTYTNFVHDSAGYGLVQWTWYSLKQELYDYCKSQGKSIGDITAQLGCLCQELSSNKLVNSLNSAQSVRAASDIFLTQFEKPKNQTEYIKNLRASYGQKYYDEFNNTSVKGGIAGMKYSNSNKPMVCMMTQSTCYRGTGQMSIKGILWHSTGANNPELRRYVQPDDNASNKSELLTKIGKNQYGNDWNHVSVEAGLNAWIGKLADGTVTTIQTMPWNYRPWGCGAGSRGSCNNGWIQFEICEDNLSNKSYFDAAYKEACELTAYLCKMYNLNPKGTVSFNGVNVPVILCHKDSSNLGLGSDHSDVYHWFNKYGKTMDNVRADVAALMGGSSTDITPTPTPSTPTSSLLGKGDEGPEVEQLQKNLIKLGYSCGSWGADGDFGNDTEKAVLKFQREHNLDADGIVGPLTQAAIEKALKEKNNGSSTPVPTPTPTPSTNEMYRVRTSWDNAKSQVGAYRNLDYAISACKAAGGNYKVFNSAGEVIYPTSTQTTTASTTTQTSTVVEQPQTVTPATKYDGVKLGSSSKDENGSYRGGQAGDQTGAEVHIQNWYDGGWHSVIRPKSAAIAEKIAVACEKACNNNKIGYDQWERNSLYAEAQKVGMDFSKITTPCECDCSSLVSTCCIAAGMPASIFYAGGNMRTTHTLIDACNATGQFTVLTSSNYTKSKDYLKRGDILLSTGHTVIVLSDGDKVGQIATITITAETYRVKVNVNKLNIRSGPSSNYVIVTQVKQNEVYTIVEEKEGWGKLKSGIGWLDLQYTQRV